MALVSAMETVDRVVRSFTEDFGRGVAVVRTEVTRERDAALALVDSARAEVEQARLALAAERERFDADRMRERAELDRAWQELYATRDRDAMLHVASETALREAHAVTAAADAMERRAQAALAAVSSGAPAAQHHSARGAPGLHLHVPPRMGPPAAGDDVMLCVIGGLAEGPSKPLSAAEAWHPSLGWRHLPDLSQPRAYCAAALTVSSRPRGGQGGVLYALGGSQGGAPLDSVEALHLDAHISAMQQVQTGGGHIPGWRRLAAMNTARVWHAACALGDDVYAVGGFDGRQYLSSLEVLDVATDAPRGMWRSLSPMPRPCSMLGLAPLKGLLYAVGGFHPPSYQADVTAYDPGTDAWWPVASLRDARREHGCAALEQLGMVVVCGGYDGARYVPSVEGFDPRAQGWRPLAPLKRPRQLLACASAGGCVYAVGGFDGKAAGTWVDVYDPRKDEWRPETPLQGGPRMAHGLVAVPL